MCGRYILTQQLGSPGERFDFQIGDLDYQANYNVAPSQQVLIVTGGGERRVERVRWVLGPEGDKDIKIGFKMINARAETVATSGDINSVSLGYENTNYVWWSHVKNFAPFGVSRPRACGTTTSGWNASVVSCKPEHVRDP